MNRTNLTLVSVAAASALALSACATSGYGTTGAGYGSAPPPSYGAPANCYDCGVITQVEPIRTGSTPSATGAILGGIIGAVAGHEISDHTGGSKGNQNVSAVAGAAAGAAAGNAVQNANETRYNVYVRMNDGRTTVVTMNSMGNLQVGSPVRVSNGRIYGM